MRLLDQRPPKWRRSTDCTTVLPLKAPAPSRAGSPDSMSSLSAYPRRYKRLFTAAVLVLSIGGLFYTFGSTPTGHAAMQIETLVEDFVSGESNPNPPLYEKWHEAELAMPQHDPDLPYPEGKEGRYFWAPNHVHASGWGNAMQELILNAHLSYVAKRTYVFDNYTWSRDLSQEYSDFNGKLIPSRIPLTALVGGPIVGDSWPKGELAPRAVRKEFFDQVCPERTVIHGQEVVSSLPSEAPASQVLQAWMDKLNSIEDRCVEIDISSAQIFEIWIFGTKRVLDIWPSLRVSPVMTQFHWSPLVHSAVELNSHLFTTTTFLSSLLSSFPLISSYFQTNYNPTLLAQYKPIPGLLALHIRRGDFVDHCHHLAKWSSQYNGFNSFPDLPDKFEAPPGGGWGETTPENDAIYIQHCFPSIAQIVERVSQVRNDEQVRLRRRGGGLKSVFIMTNGRKEWVDELKEALRRRGVEERREWENVASSRDLVLNREQKGIAQSVDMVVGQRAQVIIGNGFSSLTSNIVMLRMANGIHPDTNRFW
ncbi:hypothetical protein NEOLEDRAFT_1130722 [Neolentinus lepideus HHB14362 ss-1]|uniref:Uncharacterized protein n=1 Tax=Neolentinus lepideus HHB14362 ss-1 TaxID=1314782 RepID=A0A165U585_9AGAM|nr:hypothetical protein NEOLEDRAFT_1130722 [Neolentinus lepideus HHB14362 ss-1]